MKKITSKRILGRLNKDFKKNVLRNLARKKKYSIADNHYIFADPRGGSTWLMEIIQTITNEPVIWEPLNLEKKHNPFNSLNFDWRQHIPSQAKWEEARSLFELLFQGQILEKNILDYSSFPQYKNSKTLLFKICRGNALLPWLVENFEFKHKPVYMVRHPFAVASSQLKHGGWSGVSDRFKAHTTPYNNLYKTHENFLKSINSIEETLVARWCLHNKYTWMHKNNNKKWITIAYEDFVCDPKLQIRRILQSWNMSYDISKINFNKKSVTALKDSPESNLKKISSWQEYFKEEQIKKMQKILDYFEIQMYASDSEHPKLN